MEWIIVDDGTDKVGDVIRKSGIKQIKYVEIENKLTLGAKRNLMHTYCKGSIIVYVDDDDYFPPERVSHSVDALLHAPPNFLIAGSSVIHLYFKERGLYEFGPYGPNHATAGTFAFKRELLEKTRYDDNACLGEESFFLKEFSFPMVQLNPLKTILVFPHGHNTFDKHIFLDKPNAGPVKPATGLTIDHFIKGEASARIKDFFVNWMHTLLNDYKPGEPSMKPDVEKQTKQIMIKRNQAELEHKKQMEEYDKIMSANKAPSIVNFTAPDGTTKVLTNEEVALRLIEVEKKLQETPPITINNGGVPTPITNEQACNIMMQQQELIQQLKKRIMELEGRPIVI
jgi:hypothetical protein